MNTDFQSFCAPGAVLKEEWVPVNKSVTLKVIHIKAAVESHNPTVVFMPGWVSQPAGWKSVLKNMTRDFDVYYVETRDKLSAKVSGVKDFSVQSIGQDLNYIVKYFHLKSGQYILFGSSLGATAILDCAPNLKADPLALVLIGPNAVFRFPWWAMALIYSIYSGFSTALKPFVKWYLRHYRLNVAADQDQYEKYCDAIDAADFKKLKQSVLSVYKYKVWERLPLIDYPTLIIGGHKDLLHEPENLEKIYKMLKKGTYLEMETNARTHSPEMVEGMRNYIDNLSGEKPHAG